MFVSDLKKKTLRNADFLRQTNKMICYWTQVLLGLLQWLSSKELACQYRRCRCNPWMEKILWRRTWQLQCSCLENPMDRGAWWATVHGVAEEFGQNLVT